LLQQFLMCKIHNSLTLGRQFSFCKNCAPCALPHWKRRIYSLDEMSAARSAGSIKTANKFADPSKGYSPLTQNEKC